MQLFYNAHSIGISMQLRVGIILSAVRMECVLVKLDLEDQIVASVGTLQSLILAQTLLVNVRTAMLLQIVVSVMIITTELQMEHVKVC